MQEALWTLKGNSWRRTQTSDMDFECVRCNAINN